MRNPKIFLDGKAAVLVQMIALESVRRARVLWLVSDSRLAAHPSLFRKEVASNLKKFSHVDIRQAVGTCGLFQPVSSGLVWRR